MTDAQTGSMLVTISAALGALFATHPEPQKLRDASSGVLSALTVIGAQDQPAIDPEPKTSADTDAPKERSEGMKLAWMLLSAIPIPPAPSE